MKVFLTGSSSGIGAEFQKYLVNNAYDIYAPTRAELDLSNFNIDDISLSAYDYLILCAGVDINGRQPFINQSSDDVVNTININLISNMKLIHQYINQRNSNWSKIIIIGSTITNYVWPNFVTYGTSKVALETFTQSLERELPKTIGICTIHPGLTRTNFHFNRGNVAPEDKNILYDTMSCMNTDDLIPVFSQVLNDRKHLIKEVKLTA
jgi:short-subunit dehydrogenase